MLSTLAVFIALVSILLMFAVLIQNPKGGGIDPTFGGQAQQLLALPVPLILLKKLTWVLAGALLVLCVVAVLTVGSGGPATGADIPLQTQ